MSRALIIDDDPQFADIISLKLKHEGIDADIAHTQFQANEYLKSRTYQVILQDVFFPNKEDGLNMLKAVKDNAVLSTIPVILVTSLPTDLIEQEGDLNDYLNLAKELVSKSDDPQVIVDRVKEIISDQNHLF